MGFVCKYPVALDIMSHTNNTKRHELDTIELLLTSEKHDTAMFLLQATVQDTDHVTGHNWDLLAFVVEHKQTVFEITALYGRPDFYLSSGQATQHYRRNGEVSCTPNMAGHEVDGRSAEIKEFYNFISSKDTVF